VHRTFKSRFKGAINLKSARPAYYLDFKPHRHWRAKDEYFRGREKRNTEVKTWTVTFRTINEDSWHLGILVNIKPVIGRHKTNQIMYCYMLNGIRYGLDVPRFELRCGRDFPHPLKLGSRHIHSPQKWLPYFFEAVGAWRLTSTTLYRRGCELAEMYLYTYKDDARSHKHKILGVIS